MDKPAGDVSREDVLGLVRELRTFVNSVEQYTTQMSHLHTMHRTDLTALALIMDGKADSPKALSEMLALSPPATSALLARLEQAGHIERSRVPDNRRSVHISVTDSAREVGGSMFGLLAKHMQPVLAAQAPEDLRKATALMADLAAAARAAASDARRA